MSFITKNIIPFRGLSKMLKTTKIGVGQMTATGNVEHNLKQVETIITQGKSNEAQMVFLPEGCDFIADTREETIALSEPLTGKIVTAYKELAKSHNIWLSFGGIHELTEDKKTYNNHLIINNEGEIVSSYRKLHLFDVKIPEENVYLMESNLVKSGKKITPPIETPIGKLGLSICYDMRFPELAVALRQKGAEILTYPSAFTYATGQAHWEILLRARAIESQCYVVAAAQVGAHNQKRSSFGQAIIIDPWGKILAEGPKFDGKSQYKPSVHIAEIDLDKINNIRKKMPVLTHKRFDIYDNIGAGAKFEIADGQSFNFGGKVIPAETVFLCTELSYAFTNIRCVVPGHVLVSPIREAKRLTDLSSLEVNDLFQTVVRVQKCVEKLYNAKSSTIAIQDGEEAGQTVKHVHVHIMPRLLNDFERNDDIYEKLASHDRDAEAPIRSLEIMSNEAEELKKCLY